MIHKIFFLSSSIQYIFAAGWLVSVQPNFTEKDYVTPNHFYSRLESIFSKADAEMSSEEPRLFVLPEYIGTWLVAVNSPRNVFQSNDINGAMSWLIFSHPFRFITSFIQSIILSDFHGPLLSHIERTIFFIRKDEMRDAYEKTFSTLARKFHCWIVAGSIVLPASQIVDGKIVFF